VNKDYKWSENRSLYKWRHCASHRGSRWQRHYPI